MNLEKIFLSFRVWPVVFLVPIVAVLLLWAERRRKRRIAELFGDRFGDDPVRRIRRWTAIGGLFFAVTALLEPAIGRTDRIVDRRGADIVVALDVSRSMLAKDIAPNRLDAAKAAITKLTKKTRGDRLALVLFAGEARLVAPLTHDMAAFSTILDAAGPESIERGGTDLSAAVSTATAALGRRQADVAHVILLTDGEDLAGLGRRAAEDAARANVVLHCVGFGSTQGTKIGVEKNGGERYLLDRAGREVVTAMDKGSLSAMAQATGGQYADADRTGDALVDIFETTITFGEKTTYGKDATSEPANRFQWALAAAFLLLLLESMQARRSA